MTPSSRQLIRQQAILQTITGMLMELHREDPDKDCKQMAQNIVDYAADDELLYAIMREAECSRYFAGKILELVNLEMGDFGN